MLLSQEHSDLDGTYVQLRNARCEPKPVQQPHPPIVIGGNGPKRTLRTVARFAQQWNSTAGLDQWPTIKHTLAKRCAELGRDPATIERSVNLRYDPRGALSRSPRRFTEHSMVGIAPDLGAPLLEICLLVGQCSTPAVELHCCATAQRCAAFDVGPLPPITIGG